MVIYCLKQGWTQADKNLINTEVQNLILAKNIVSSAIIMGNLN